MLNILSETYPFYFYFLLSWLFLSAVIFLILFKVTAPYGRHIQEGWGIKINNTIGWIVMEIPAVLVFAFFFLSGDENKSIVNWIFFIIWQIHYIHRSLIYPFRLPNKKKFMPLLIAVSAIFFNLGNGYLNGYYFGTIVPDYSIDWLYDPRFILGVLIFFSGFIINIHSDNILLNLRKTNNTGYSIPRGGFFKWISSPNYFGEVLEWCGWALATWSLPGLAFAIWTAANLIPRAISNHKWYREKFADYPHDRKAVFPFLL